jgi:hypothetical protein
VVLFEQRHYTKVAEVTKMDSTFHFRYNSNNNNSASGGCITLMKLGNGDTAQLTHLGQSPFGSI